VKVMSYFLHYKSWVKIREEVTEDDTVIVPFGSLEAHGPHKPVGCCYLLAEASSREIGERTGVTVTPVIPFGVSESWRNFPGTITVDSSALFEYTYQVGLSLVNSGYKKIIFLSAHGGNNLSVLRELSFKLRAEHGVLCAVIHVWGMISRMAPDGFWGKGQRIGHGGDPVTSVMLYLHPELVDMSKAVDSPLGEVLEGFKSRSYDVHDFMGVPVNVYLFAEEVEPSGLMGDPTKASAKKGESLYLKAMDFIVDFVEAFRKLSPNR